MIVRRNYNYMVVLAVVEFDDVKLSCGGANMGAIYLLLLGD